VGTQALGEHGLTQVRDDGDAVPLAPRDHSTHAEFFRLHGRLNFR